MDSQLAKKIIIDVQISGWSCLQFRFCSATARSVRPD